MGRRISASLSPSPSWWPSSVRLASEIFFQPRNLTNILNAVAILGLIASAQTIVIISGGIDVSVGSIVGVSGVTAAIALMKVDVTTAGIVAPLLVGTLCGLANGLLVTMGRVNAIIATLATMATFRGLAYILTNGRGIGIVDADYNWLGSGRLLGVPVAVIVFGIMAVLLANFMRATDLGRNIYAIGGNPSAAKLVGIDVQTIPHRRVHAHRLCVRPRGRPADGPHDVRPARIRLGGTGA